MITKNYAKLLALSTILYSGTAISGETLLYDFNNYIPSLDKAYEKNESSINSGYSIAFDSSASASDNDFVFYKINDDLTTSPVYYKISVDFLGEDRIGEVYNTVQVNSGNIDEYTGYFYESQGTHWMDPGAFF